MSLITMLKNTQSASAAIQNQKNTQPSQAERSSAATEVQTEQTELLVSKIARNLRAGEQLETLPEFELFKSEFSTDVVSVIMELANGVQERLSPDGRLVVEKLLDHHAKDGVLRHIWHDLPVQLERLSEEERAIATVMLLIRI